MARGLSLGAIACILALNPGCAKLHNKLHKHHHSSEHAFGTYPASAPPAQPGLASVSPQTANAYSSTPLIYKTAPMGPSVAPVYEGSPSLSNTGSVTTTTPSAESTPPPAPPMDQPPVAATPKPVTVPPIPKPVTPPAEPVKAATLPPAAAPSVKLPDIAPPSIDLPNLPPADTLPPPSGGPRSSSSAPVAPGSVSPFASTPAPKVATNSPVVSGPVLTLTQPGDGDAPPAPPAEEKPARPVSAKPSVNVAPPVIAPAPPLLNKPVAAPSGGSTTGVKTSQNSNSSKSDVAKLDSILQKTSLTLGQISSYRVQVSLQEQMNGKLLPPDSFQLSKRREPFAVRMEWSQGKEAGREVIFSPVYTNGMIQIRMPKGLIPRISMSPESPLVRSKSRHPISEAGADSVVDRLRSTLDLHKQNRPDAGQLEVTTVVEPVVGQVDRIKHVTSTGETWVVDMDSSTGLPLTIHATDPNGQLLEHYEFRKYELNRPDLMTADAFDPNARWGQASLFGKIARSGSNDSQKR